MKIISGKIKSAQRVVIYGCEGIGKTTLAAAFPEPVFLDLEGGTKEMNVSRLSKPNSWSMFLQQIEYIRTIKCSTLVIDTADWAERLCIEHVCAKGDETGPKANIESFGWGRGYTVLGEEFGRLLDKLTIFTENGINIVFTAHSWLHRFEQPEEVGAYDRYELKLGKKSAPLLQEWADMLLFCNYKTEVIEINNKKKAQGHKRTIYAEHRPSWNAKNRHGLKPELPFSYSSIAHCIPDMKAGQPQAQPQPEAQKNVEPDTTADLEKQGLVANPAIQQEDNEKVVGTVGNTQPTAFNTQLYDLMQSAGITEAEIQWACANPPGGKPAYYPINTPVDNYDESFVKSVLVAHWQQVAQHILACRK